MFDIAGFGASVAWSFLLTVLAGIAAFWVRGSRVSIRRRFEVVYDYEEKKTLEGSAAEALQSLPPPAKESSPKRVERKTRNSGVEGSDECHSGLSEEDDYVVVANLAASLDEEEQQERSGSEGGRGLRPWRGGSRQQSYYSNTPAATEVNWTQTPRILLAEGGVQTPNRELVSSGVQKSVGTANIAVTALPLSESAGIQTDPPAVADCGVGDNDIGGTEEVAVQTEAVGALGSWRRFFTVARRLSFLRRVRAQLTDHVRQYDGLWPPRRS